MGCNKCCILPGPELVQTVTGLMVGVDLLQQLGKCSALRL